jgi:hypothetical protein
LFRHRVSGPWQCEASRITDIAYKWYGPVYRIIPPGWARHHITGLRSSLGRLPYPARVLSAFPRAPVALSDPAVAPLASGARSSR